MSGHGVPVVAMVVTNGVVGDSRVQKIAWTAAEAGWDTVLVGVSPDGTRREGSIGRARVVLVPIPGRGGLRWRVARTLRAVRNRIHRLAVPPRAGIRRPTLAVPEPDPGGWRGRLGRGVWRLSRAQDWQRSQPALAEVVSALAVEVVAARPDVVHGHDYRGVLPAAEAVRRLRASGRTARLVYDAHEYLPGITGPDPVWRAALRAGEDAAVAMADAVITVSDRMAELLVADHGLTDVPAVVLNAPVVDARPEKADAGPTVGLRDALGLAPDVPLAVYSGAAAPQRGLDSLVDALSLLPDLHLALVVPPGRYVEALRERARRLGAADRLHLTGYVPASEVTRHLAQASVAVVPSLHVPNHEVDLPTKYYEYAQARLPLAVSDLAEVGRVTRELGNGEVFTAGDGISLSEALRAILSRRQHYVDAYSADVLDAMSWRRQAGILLGVYERLVPVAPITASGAVSFAEAARSVERLSRKEQQ